MASMADNPRSNGQKWAMAWVITMLLSPLLFGCTHTVTVACPAPTVWSAGQQAEAADELLALPPGSVLVDMMLDYARERAELRACQ